MADVVAPLDELGRDYDVVIVDTPPASRLALDIGFLPRPLDAHARGVDTGEPRRAQSWCPTATT